MGIISKIKSLFNGKPKRKWKKMTSEKANAIMFKKFNAEREQLEKEYKSLKYMSKKWGDLPDAVAAVEHGLRVAPDFEFVISCAEQLKEYGKLSRKQIRALNGLTKSKPMNYNNRWWENEHEYGDYGDIEPF